MVPGLRPARSGTGTSTRFPSALVGDPVEEPGRRLVETTERC
jgi:hypothetical protein